MNLLQIDGKESLFNFSATFLKLMIKIQKYLGERNNGKESSLQFHHQLQ